MEDNLNQILARITSIPKQSREYKCDKCRDSGFIGSGYEYAECECQRKERAERRMKKNGFEPGRMTFKDFDEKTKGAARMKEIAEKFLADYPNCSMAVLGQVGAGKTHIIIATAQALIDREQDVYYMPYMDIMAIIRQNRFDEEGYAKVMNEIKNCGVLVIDDLFKGSIKPNDIDIVFEIVNNRYLNKKPMMISSEKSLDELTAIDEAIGTRLAQMTKGYRVIIGKDPAKNRRMHE